MAHKSDYFSIGEVAERTGVSADVLRSWERRYGAFNPFRDQSGNRNYSTADLDRIRLLKILIECGHSIKRIAQLSHTQLERLVAAEEGGIVGEIDNYLGSLESFDVGSTLAQQDMLNRRYTKGCILTNLLMPLLRQFRARQRAGDFNAIHEQMFDDWLALFAGAYARNAVSLSERPFIVCALGQPEAVLYSRICCAILYYHEVAAVFAGLNLSPSDLCNVCQASSANTIIVIYANYSNLESWFDALASNATPATKIVAVNMSIPEAGSRVGASDKLLYFDSIESLYQSFPSIT